MKQDTLPHSNKTRYYSYQRDISSAIAVVLVALLLCLEIALASGAPLLSGIIAGVVGGVLVGLLSGSELSVSGPAAGLVAVVVAAIQTLGGYTNFLVAVVLAGFLQIALSYLRAGILKDFVPRSIVRGMLAAIGILIILRQIPYVLGGNIHAAGEFDIIEPTGQLNALSEIVRSLVSAHPTAIGISAISALVILLWEHIQRTKRSALLNVIPAALIAVTLGTVCNEVCGLIFPSMCLRTEQGHLVQLPILAHPQEFLASFHVPNVLVLTDASVYLTAATLALIASIETLLSLEAVDKLDPLHRSSDANKELRAQGIGNIVSGILGDLPITSVVVRSSANTIFMPEHVHACQQLYTV
ncbi:MAG: SulP family inorganic anion transporter [Bacteroidota bacterium]|nr:SulP family inorganic anion transporter [Candidatus Kapabacteria bacterium]MDW8219040.1 SulP family inorganic anion transporter [Bacteroidota bacterium]